MFKSIRYIGIEKDWNGYSSVFQIIDDSFIESFRVHSRQRHNLVWRIAEIYRRRHLNVAKNVAVFYISLFPVRPFTNTVTYTQECDDDATYIDEYYPILSYSKRYLKCVKRHINLFLWSRGHLT